MISVACDVQVNGLGRCFAKVVDHNVIYLGCPATKTMHCYDVAHGNLSEVWGPYTTSAPTEVVRFNPDTNSLEHHWFVPGEERDQKWNKWYKTGEASNEKALDAVPTACFAVTKAILDGKDGDLVEKAMVEYVKVKVNRLRSTGGYRFLHEDEEWDLERCLQEMKRAIVSKHNINYTFDDSVVVNRFTDRYLNLFK